MTLSPYSCYQLVSLGKFYPVVSITGPRQSGKTTLAKTTFPKLAYVSLEDPDERDFALHDPRGFLKRFSKGAILDEVQRAPDLLSYLQGIQAGFIVHLLPPHHENFSKRLIKSPKLYFLDSGLLCYLLRVRGPDDLVNHPLRGAIFESFVFSEIYKAFAHTGEAPPLYFWRDRTGHEVDLVIDAGEKLIPVEIKSGETIAETYFNGLNYYRSPAKRSAAPGVLVYGGEKSYRRDSHVVRTWYQCS